jgi:ubiquinone/menaquinone biosynthesis C-methylase UbiE
MGWYDLFSRVYDKSLEPLYVESRAAAVEALRLRPGQVVLDVPCGTGASFPGIREAIGDDGLLVGVDRSTGMLARARARIERAGWSNVVLGEADVHAIDHAMISELAEIAGREFAIDRVHVFLGLTAFDRWQEAFARLWDVLAPGGRFVIVDVHAERPSLQGRMVNLVARADIRRRVWEPLESAAVGRERRELPSLPQHGGSLVLAAGDKPT